MDRQWAEVVMSSIVSSGVIGTICIWFIKTQVQTRTDVALSKQQDAQFEKDINNLKTDLRDTKGNFNAKFADTKNHITTEVDRAIAVVEQLAKRVDAQQLDVQEIEINCARNHGIATRSM